MDGSRLSTAASASQKSSGLPRQASRLPQPRSSAIPTPTQSLRHVASTDGLRGRQLRPASGSVATAAPRLKTSASREQVKPTTATGTATSTVRKPQRIPGPPLSFQVAVQDTARASRSLSRGPAVRGSYLSTIAAHHGGTGVVGSSNSLPRLAGSGSGSGDDLNPEPQEPRSSLSARTVETLAQLPSSPGFKRRGSNFFESELPSLRPLSSRTENAGSRPGSGYQSDGSAVRSHSRPGSRSGPPGGSHGSLRASSGTLKSNLPFTQGTPAQKAAVTVKPPGYRPVSASTKRLTATPLSTLGTKMAGEGRTLRPRASMNGLKKKPSASSLAPRNPSSASSASTTLTAESSEGGSSAVLTSHKTSAALREQIAKAKAAKRAATRTEVTGAPVPTSLKSPRMPADTTFDPDLPDDPFGQAKFGHSNHNVMRSRIESARTTGRLNVAAMGLKQIPEEILKMYDLESIGGHGGAWAESVDLTRFIAADNELEVIGESIFPDTDPSDFAEDDNGRGHQFGGLESLDLHGNQLIGLPVGLRRLQLLTALNLTNNKLDNGCLETLSQISPLRDLKLGGNLLRGKLDSNLSSLENLEILDLKGNDISGLPDGMERLTRLRVLNIGENAFESLPFGALAGLPLIELLAYKNRLTGTLVDVGVEVLPHLQTLDVSSNQLTLLALGKLSMPSLLQCTVSLNRLQALPDLSSWTGLLTLNAGENNMTAIPDGFTDLGKLRHVDFTSNNIRTIPPEVARMDALSTLRISGNPLRDKKFTSMTTEDLKDSLLARLESLTVPRGAAGQLEGGRDPSSNQGLNIEEIAETTDGDRQSELDDLTTPLTSAQQSPVRSQTPSQSASSQTWPIKAGGILDRASTQSSSLHPVVCSKIAAGQVVCDVRLQHNLFTTMPESLSFFADTLTTLSMSHNQLVGEGYLTEQLDLLALKELTLSNNHITSLRPLFGHLRAPNLRKLDISFNRIVSLPVLREAFPLLTVLLISNNHLEDLEPDSVSGLQVVAADNNDIAHLNPRLGLLRLERLEVNGNRFRVPRWNVLERGTEATLRWLRGRVPVAEMAEWRAKYGENADNDGDLGDFD